MEYMSCDLEVKFAGSEPMTFEGYGSVFGNIDSHGDVVAAGAFAETLGDAKKSNKWPPMLLQHGGWGISADDMTPIGIWTDMVEDGKGLRVIGKLADTPRGKEIHTLMKMTPRPAISGMSIGYIAKDWTPRTKPEEPKRTLKRVDLVELSVVTFPANGKARMTAVKSDFSERDFERLLMRDAGLSRSEAQVVINQGFKSLLAMRDAGSDELSDLAALVQRNVKALAA